MNLKTIAIVLCILFGCTSAEQSKKSQHAPTDIPSGLGKVSLALVSSEDAGALCVTGKVLVNGPWPEDQDQTSFNFQTACENTLHTAALRPGQYGVTLMRGFSCTLDGTPVGCSLKQDDISFVVEANKTIEVVLPIVYSTAVQQPPIAVWTVGGVDIKVDGENNPSVMCGDAGACPDGKICASLNETDARCYKQCTDDANCEDGTTCQKVGDAPEDAGTFIKICLPPREEPDGGVTDAGAGGTMNGSGGASSTGGTTAGSGGTQSSGGAMNASGGTMSSSGGASPSSGGAQSAGGSSPASGGAGAGGRPPQTVCESGTQWLTIEITAPVDHIFCYGAEVAKGDTRPDMKATFFESWHSFDVDAFDGSYWNAVPYCADHSLRFQCTLQDVAPDGNKIEHYTCNGGAGVRNGETFTTSVPVQTDIVNLHNGWNCQAP